MQRKKRILSVLAVKRPVLNTIDNTGLGEVEPTSHRVIPGQGGPSKPSHKRPVSKATRIIEMYQNYMREAKWWSVWYGHAKVLPTQLPPTPAHTVLSCENGHIDTTEHGTTRSRVIPATELTPKQLEKLRNLASLTPTAAEYHTSTMEITRAREILEEYETRGERQRMAIAFNSARRDMLARHEYQRMALKREMARDSGMFPNGETRPVEWRIVYRANPQFRRPDGKPSYDAVVLRRAIPAIPNTEPMATGRDYLAHNQSAPAMPMLDSPTPNKRFYASVGEYSGFAYMPRIPLSAMVPLASR